MRDAILITKSDLDKLQRLIAGRRGVNRSEAEYLDELEQELDRAEIVDEDDVPDDVVTMNSTVRLKDLDSGEVKVYTLVFPTEPRTETSISVLAPIGTALLGYRAGDVIEWRVPRGIRRLKVLEVLSRPLATAGRPSGRAKR